MEQQWLGPCSSLYNFQSAHLPAQECFLLLILLFTTTAVSGTGIKAYFISIVSEEQQKSEKGMFKISKTTQIV